MNILITGGSGFIGKNFIKFLIKKNEISKIINIDINQKNFFLHSKVINKKSNINNEKTVNSILQNYKPSLIVNFAAHTHVDRSIYDPINFFKNNVIKTAIFFETIRKKYIKNKNFRILHVSTDEVYGSLKLKERSFSEKNKYFPNNPYSASKASADHLAHSYFKTLNFPILISNCSNNYGPYQSPEKLIPLIINNCVNKKTIPIYGKGDQVRDWLHVDDHCNALWRILRKGKLGENYNIGGTEECSNLYITRQICKIMDRFLNDKNPCENLIKFVKDRPGHDFRYSINYDKIKNNLKWKPKVNLKKGLYNTIKWYLQNYKWLKKQNTKKHNLWIKKNYEAR